MQIAVSYDVHTGHVYPPSEIKRRPPNSMRRRVIVAAFPTMEEAVGLYILLFRKSHKELMEMIR